MTLTASRPGHDSRPGLGRPAPAVARSSAHRAALRQDVTDVLYRWETPEASAKLGQIGVLEAAAVVTAPDGLAARQRELVAEFQVAAPGAAAEHASVAAVVLSYAELAGSLEPARLPAAPRGGLRDRLATAHAGAVAWAREATAAAPRDPGAGASAFDGAVQAAEDGPGRAGEGPPGRAGPSDPGRAGSGPTAPRTAPYWAR
jgi:hypothetical protein